MLKKSNSLDCQASAPAARPHGHCCCIMVLTGEQRGRESFLAALDGLRPNTPTPPRHASQRPGFEDIAPATPSGHPPLHTCTDHPLSFLRRCPHIWTGVGRPQATPRPTRLFRSNQLRRPTMRPQNRLNDLQKYIPAPFFRLVALVKPDYHLVHCPHFWSPL